jgi:hypothetical protein
MGTIARVLGGVVIVVGAAVGIAAPASADQPMEGVYSYHADGAPPALWTIFPICVPTVGDLREPLELPVACTLHVASATDNKTTYELNALNWGGDAKLTGGQWTVITSNTDGFLCPDGSTAPSQDTYKFDDVTLTGVHTLANVAQCGVQPGMKQIPFTLKYEQPLSNPVDRYPLVCEPAGNRLCR